MRAWVLDRHGEPGDVLTLRDVAEPKPGDGQLLVDVETAGVGFPDLLRIQGKYQIELPVGASPGQELVGVVRHAGAGTSIEVGTRIVAVSQIGHGALADHVIVNEMDTAAISDDLSAEVGAAVPANYGTAYIALHHRARIAAGEAVVISGGAGGVGSAAIQLAKAAGARVLAIDTGADRVRFCLDLGADAAADSSTDDLVTAMNDFTGAQGVNVVIDMVGGPVFEAARKAIASEGRIVIVGFTSGTIPEIKVNRLLLRNFAVIGMNAFHYAAEMAECYAKVAALCAEGSIVPAIDGVYSFDDVPAVFARLADGLVRGKAIVRVSDPTANVN